MSLSVSGEVDGTKASFSNFFGNTVIVQNCAVIKSLPVEGYIKYIVGLNEIDVLIEKLDALLVIQNAGAYFLFAAKALDCLFNDVAQGWPVIFTKIYNALLLRLVYTSVNSDFYLRCTTIVEEIYHFTLIG